MINYYPQNDPYKKGRIIKVSEYLMILMLSVFITCSTRAQLITDTAQLSHITSSLTKQKELAKYRFEACFSIFKTRLTADERQAMEFLYAYMPLSDLADYEASFFLKNVRMSLRARNEMPWGMTIPEDIFIHFVLPVRVNNENLDTFRMAVYEDLKKRVAVMDMATAAIEVNHWCHEKVTYKASDERTSSPLQSMCTSFGRCGEESTFTVAAMRAVGIPARQVYTPRWAHCDDNHAWVEVWINGIWHFLGACEPEAQLDRGWFAGPAKRAMLVHTRVYGWYSGKEPVISRQEKFSELNLIANYAPAKTFVVKVTDTANRNIDSAKVEYQLYNYAEFYPLAKTFTGADGNTSMTTGLGDLLIWASKDDAFGYKKITVESTDTVIIQISHRNLSGFAESFDMVPPVERTLANVDIQDGKENERRLRYEDSVRSLYMKTFMDTVSALALADSLSIDRDSTVSLLLKSYGNWKNIVAFISNTMPGQRSRALQMLYCITDKDVRDVPEKVLRDHFDNGYLFSPIETYNDPGFFIKYVVNGRISNENFTDWRHTLQSSFDKAFIEKLRRDVTPALDFVREHVIVDALSNAHSRAPLTPAGVLSLRVADPHSRDIFYVALCRSFGIPARLNPETSAPQFFREGSWHTAVFDSLPGHLANTGTLSLRNTATLSDPKYFLDFTISKFSNGVFRTLSFDELMPVSKFPAGTRLDAGRYMIVSGYRLPDGTVLCRVEFFELPRGKDISVEVIVRDKVFRENAIGRIRLKKFIPKSYGDHEKVNPAAVAGNKGLVIAFIEPDKEPSKHVLADIAQMRDGFDKWGGGILFALSPESVTQAFNPALITGMPVNSLFVWDNDNKLRDEVFRIMERNDAGDLPLVVLTDKIGNVYFYSHGYRIGIGEQLLKRIQKL